MRSAKPDRFTVALEDRSDASILHSHMGLEGNGTLRGALCLEGTYLLPRELVEEFLKQAPVFMLSKSD